MLPRPTAAQERWLVLADRHPALRAAAEARAGGWKTTSLLTRVLMFALGLFAASLITGSLLWMPARFLFAGLAMVMAGEWLIRQRRLFAGGIEEALLLCGAVAVVGQLLDWIGHAESAGVLALLSFAVLATGLRVGNAFFTSLAAAGFSWAIAAFDRKLWDGSGLHDIAALAFCVSAAACALALGARDWARPSHDRMLDGLVIAMPAAAQGWLLAATPQAGLTASLALVFGVTLGAVGVQRRTHAPLLGALIQVGFLIWALRAELGLAPPGRLIVIGGVLLGIAGALERGLRRPWRGFTSAPLAPSSELEGLLQVAAATHATPAPPATPGTVEGQGGSFGGGGASGRF